MIELRLRNRVSDEELNEKVGKILTDDDYNVLLTGPTRLRKPDGKPLAIYLPGALKDLSPEMYPLFHRLRASTTNRGLASGSKRVKAGKRGRALSVDSAIVGYFESKPPNLYCRLTAFTAHKVAEWDGIQPYLRRVSGLFREHVPARFQAQMSAAADTDPEWVIAGTPFTTVTVNNTYPTGVHTDKGDLEEGFSCLGVIRRGDYSGGRLCFPRFRVAVDMQDGDLCLMDAHEWHGNTALDKHSPDAERISVVHYFRTAMTDCGTLEEETARAVRNAERRSGFAESNSPA